MFRSLYAKLAVGLVALFTIVGLFAIGITLFASEMYQQEVNQKLNRELAQHIVQEKHLLQDKLVDQEALKGVFHDLMVLNPSIELYLLDTEGKILSYSAAAGKVKRDFVDLAPVHAWLAGAENLPLLGEDPRNEQREKAFSAARIVTPNGLEGYLYIILGGEDYDTVAHMAASSYIAKVSIWLIVAVTVLALVAGLILLARLVRRLKKLSDAMSQFRAGEMPAEITDASRCTEIERLTNAFHTMASQINDQLKKLEQTDQLRRELVANVSHDLRTPLATLQGYIETLLLKNHTLDEKERSEYLEIIIKHCQRLNKLVSELLELARLDANEVKLKAEDFSLLDLVQDVIQKFQLKARNKGIHVDVRFNRQIPFVRGDIAMIERVLENLLENALRYTPDSGTITLDLVPTKNGVQLEVRDTGCGIPEDEIPKIFNRFYQIDKSRNADPGSSGLGLAIAKRIVELHGGNIDVKSVLNQGTCFSFDLPALSA